MESRLRWILFVLVAASFLAGCGGTLRVVIMTPTPIPPARSGVTPGQILPSVATSDPWPIRPASPTPTQAQAQPAGETPIPMAKLATATPTPMSIPQVSTLSVTPTSPCRASSSPPRRPLLRRWPASPQGKSSHRAPPPARRRPRPQVKRPIPRSRLRRLHTHRCPAQHRALPLPRRPQRPRRLRLPDGLLMSHKGSLSRFAAPNTRPRIWRMAGSCWSAALRKHGGAWRTWRSSTRRRAKPAGQPRSTRHNTRIPRRCCRTAGCWSSEGLAGGG